MISGASHYDFPQPSHLHICLTNLLGVIVLKSSKLRFKIVFGTVLGDKSLSNCLTHGTERILETLQAGLELISGLLHPEQLRILWAGYK